MAWDPAVIAAVGGACGAILAGIPGVISAIVAARKATETAAKVDSVGKQVGQHVYEQRDRDSTLMERLGSTQRAAEAAAMKPSAVPEETVSGYRRRAKAAAEELEGLVQQAKMVMGHTPTEKVRVVPMTPGYTGKVPPPPPVKPEDE